MIPQLFFKLIFFSIYIFIRKYQKDCLNLAFGSILLHVGIHSNIYLKPFETKASQCRDFVCIHMFEM